MSTESYDASGITIRPNGAAQTNDQQAALDIIEAHVDTFDATNRDDIRRVYVKRLTTGRVEVSIYYDGSMTLSVRTAADAVEPLYSVDNLLSHSHQVTTFTLSLD